MRLGLRAQLLIVSSLLLAIPLLGLRAAREIETFLVETQEQGLTSTARAVATALNERPAVFVRDSETPSGVSPNGAPSLTLRIETLARPITLDGSAEDWSGQRGEMKELTGSRLAVVGSVVPAPSLSPSSSPSSSPLSSPSGSPSGSPSSSSPSPTPIMPLKVRYRLGRYERGVYLLVEVRDEAVVRHESDFPRVDASDHVELAMVTADDEFLRFVLSEGGDGSPRLSLMSPDGLGLPDPRIEGMFVETEDGYRVEARIPRTLIGSRLGLAVVDVDDRATRTVVARVATGPTDRRDVLSRVVVPSPELAVLAQGLGRARSRLWVLDTQGKVLAQAGTLQGSRTPLAPLTWRQSLVMALRPLYGSILVEPREDFTDKGPDASQLEGPEISEALAGRSAHGRRRTSDGRAVVLSSAEPVWSDGGVVGAILAEETTNETLAARNRAFERLFFSIALVMIFGTLTLLAFATRLSFRIRGLRNSVERAIDRQGRVRASIEASDANDEVGDLSRSFGSMLERQQQYTAYLEDLRSRLSHEIRTPVAVVRSSLDNLRLQQIPTTAGVYLDRADEGLSRLVTIVQRMTEASRLEQTLAISERETFDLVQVVTGCVHGYRLANPGRQIDFIVDAGHAPLLIEGAPDLVAQLLDKLVENALDFARDGTPIEVRLTRGLGIAFLAVSNEGKTLPEDVGARIFESMISARPADGSGKVHLGLGLTIVRAIADFHQATATASNRRDPEGVTFSVAFPLQSRLAQG